MVCVGVDYSMKSPAVCVYDSRNGEFKFENLEFFIISNSTFVPTKEITRIKHPSTFECPPQRYDLISSFFVAELKKRPISSIVMEDYSFKSKGKVFNIAENSGHFKFRMWEHGLPLTLISPSEVKKFATGNGNASKTKMHEAFVKAEGFDLQKKLGDKKDLDGSDCPTADLVDAYWMCRMAYSSLPDRM